MCETKTLRYLNLDIGPKYVQVTAEAEKVVMASILEDPSMCRVVVVVVVRKLAEDATPLRRGAEPGQSGAFEAEPARCRWRCSGLLRQQMAVKTPPCRPTILGLCAIR